MTKRLTIIILLDVFDFASHKLDLFRNPQLSYGDLKPVNQNARVKAALAADLCREFPKMSGLSLRNLRYMRSFAEAWKDEGILQAVLAKLIWYHNIALLEKILSQDERLWYTRATMGSFLPRET